MSPSNSELAKAGNNAVKKIRSEYTDLKSEYPELGDIQKDMQKLKGDVDDLLRHAKSNSGRYVREAKDFAWHQVERAQDAAHKGLEAVESRVKEKPGQTLAAAFFAGLVASLFLGRRR
jgi:ElaB/YqjD/DUF883 family membrane-anchored ribosome-binding protein